MLLSVVLGLVSAIVRIRVDPDPPGAPGLVGFPLICLLLHGIGRFLGERLHAWCREVRGQWKGEHTAELKQDETGRGDTAAAREGIAEEGEAGSNDEKTMISGSGDRRL